jgi:hypothetical protein
VQEATDSIGRKIEAYQNAIRKHGLPTRREVLLATLSLGGAIPVAGGVVATAGTPDPVWEAMAGGILSVGGTTAWVAKKLLTLDDLKRGQHREVAYLYAIQALVA